MALRTEYPELDARLKRFVNVGNIRLSKKGACDKLFPELSPAVAGLSKTQVEREQRKLVGEYASTFDHAKQVMKTITRDGVSTDTATVSLQQLGVDKAKQAQQKVIGTTTALSGHPVPLVPTDRTDLGDLPPLPDAHVPPVQDARLQTVESQLSALQRTFDRELGVLHSKNELLQGSLQAIIRKLDDMGGNS